MDSNSSVIKDLDYDEESCCLQSSCLPEATACMIADSSYVMAGADIERSHILNMARSEANDIVTAAKREAKCIQEEVARWELEKERIAKVQTFGNNPVQLDVGGSKFTTSLTTLCRFPESLLGVMFSGRHELAVSSDGCYFIDRDGSHFKHILNFLRDPENFCEYGPSTDREIRELRIEATYYGLHEVMFAPPITLGSSLNEEGEPLLQEEREHTSSFRASIGGIFLRVTVSQDSQRRWCLLPDKNIYCNPSTPVVATCCRACGSAYIPTQSFLSPHIGIKGFVGGTRGRLIENIEQPRPEPRTCPTCPHT